MTFSCLYVRYLINDYVDGELSPNRLARVRAHMKECAGCRARVGSMRTIRRMVRAMEPPQVSATEWDDRWISIQVAAAAAPSGETTDEHPRVRLEIGRGGRYAIAGAIAAVALFAVLGIQWWGGQEEAHRQSTATFISYHENALYDHVLLENHFYSAQAVAVGYLGQ